jgi:uncharacterized protein (DUF302 family)
MQESGMYHISDTDKSVDQACADLEAAVKAGGFGVLHVHDLGATLRAKGVSFAEECRIFEVCNPVQAARVLGSEMRLNMALPCRISVYTERGQTRIGLLKPVPMLTALSDDPALMEVAEAVQEAVIGMVSAAR